MLDAPCLSSHSPTDPVEVEPTDGDQTQRFRVFRKRTRCSLSSIYCLGAQYSGEQTPRRNQDHRLAPRSESSSHPYCCISDHPQSQPHRSAPPFDLQYSHETADNCHSYSALGTHAVFTVFACYADRGPRWLDDAWATVCVAYRAVLPSIMATTPHCRRAKHTFTVCSAPCGHAAVRTCCLRFEGSMPNDAVSLNRFRTDTRCSNKYCTVTVPFLYSQPRIGSLVNHTVISR